MKMLLNVEFPPEPFNTLVRNGKVEGIIKRILDDIKPEIAYFTELEGSRGGIFIIDVPEPSSVPRLAEPFFLEFNADCRFRIAMTPDDLGKAGLGEIGRQWP